MATNCKTPVSLPAGWIADEVRGYGMVIEAVDAEGRRLGAVTVDETVRGFAMGMTGVSRTLERPYTGRGWRARLYSDAIARLQNTYSL